MFPSKCPVFLPDKLTISEPETNILNTKCFTPFFVCGLFDFPKILKRKNEMN
jgi:hypothetical protein